MAIDDDACASAYELASPARDAVVAAADRGAGTASAVASRG
jgi:hypothetical protein